MKKTLSVLLTFALVLSLVPAFAVHFSAKSVGAWQYDVKNGTAVVTDYYGDVAGDIVVPSTLGGYTVTVIGDSAFFNRSAMTGITLPDSVTEIAWGAFKACSSLSSITLPDGLTSIAPEAFQGCGSLTSINIPANVTNIGAGAFSDCPSLESITVDEKNTFFSDAGNCLTEISSGNLIAGCASSVIPSDGSVTSIGSSAFWGRNRLTQLTVPSSVTWIASSAFAYCPGLTSITVDKNNTEFFSVDNCLIEKSSKKLVVGCKTSIIPSDGSVTEIGARAFAGCTDLTKISIPDSVTKLGVNAFSGSGLAEVSLPNITEITDGAFSACPKLTRVRLPDGLKNIGDNAFNACPELTQISFPAGLRQIGRYAFYGCSKLTFVKIPDSATQIGACAFLNCAELKFVLIPASVVNIGNSAFDGCDNLTIYGVKGSYAETYANKKGIPFVEYRELTDTSSGVTVGGGVPENAELSVVVKAQTSEKAVFDISLVKDGETVQPNGAVLVALPVPQGMNGADMRVYRIADNGAKTDMNAVYSNGFMIFDTDHFSVYSIEPTLNIVYGDADGSGEVDITDAMLVFYHVAKKELLPEDALVRCNVNDDNDVDIADAMAIFYFVAKKTDSVRP